MGTTTAMLLGAGSALAGIITGGGLVLLMTWAGRKP